MVTPQMFAVGQLVDFDTRIEPTPRTKGPYEVLRVLPADDEMKPRVYRIKSQAEPFERNVNEYEIVAVVPVAPISDRAALTSDKRRVPARGERFAPGREFERAAK
jgi:hypothetical protein